MISYDSISNVMSIKRVIQEITKNHKFLITSHIGLEGDALGSELAMKALLDRLDKSSFIVNEQEVPREYEFLPGVDTIRKHNQVGDFDVAIVLDCSDLFRTGRISKLITQDKLVINIDHHISNSKFGKINWIDPRSSCACEMVYRLYKELKIPFDRNSALAMYIGILTDTGSFRYSNTAPFTHKVVAELLRKKIAVNQVYRRIYEYYSLSDIKFLGSQISRLNSDQKGKIVWLDVDLRSAALKKTLMDLTDAILNLARSIKSAEVVLLFKQISANEVRVNLRSNGKIDVNRLAKMFGGGGHKTASGFTIKGNIRSVQGRVLKEARRVVY